MRINWGTFIFVLYMSFVGLMAFLVYKTFQPKVDLVSTDYYAKEIAFQGQLDATKAAQTFSVPVSCKVENGQLLMALPSEMQGKSLTGTVYFYCPWNADNDKTVPFTSASQTEVKLALPSLPKGKYEVKVDWKADEKDYHVEETVFI